MKKQNPIRLLIFIFYTKIKPVNQQNEFIKSWINFISGPDWTSHGWVLSSWSVITTSVCIWFFSLLRFLWLGLRFSFSLLFSCRVVLIKTTTITRNIIIDSFTKYWVKHSYWDWNPTVCILTTDAVNSEEPEEKTHDRSRKTDWHDF